MTTHEEWTSQLSALVDGELPPERRAALERHLAECLPCRSVLEDLRAIVGAAPSYLGAEPPHDLWPDIAREIERRKELPFPAAQEQPTRRFTAWHLIAASLAAAVVGLGSAWLGLREDRAPVPAVVDARRDAPTWVVVNRPTPDEAYDQAVGDLQRILAEGRDRLEPATARVIEDNLRIIDRAIAEAQAAIAADSTNVDLQSWVAAHKQQKLDLLRRTALAIALRTTES